VAWKSWVLWILGIGLVLLSSCAPEQPASWTDDFSDPGSGWKTESDASAEVGYHDGKMRIFVVVPNRLAWVSLAQEFSDFRLTVDATQVAGPDDNEYGVLVRMKDSGSFYRFSISGDGYYMISKYDGDIWTPLSGDWAPSDAIHSGQAKNQIVVVCDGAHLEFFVNDVLMAEIDDESYAKGGIGLYVGSFFESGVEVHFDNLTVSSP